jgi:hypothetical protein
MAACVCVLSACHEVLLRGVLRTLFGQLKKLVQANAAAIPVVWEMLGKASPALLAIINAVRFAAVAGMPAARLFPLPSPQPLPWCCWHGCVVQNRDAFIALLNEPIVDGPVAAPAAAAAPARCVLGVWWCHPCPGACLRCVHAHAHRPPTPAPCARL